MLIDFRSLNDGRSDIFLDERFVGIQSRRRFLQVIPLSERELYSVRRQIADQEGCAIDDVTVFGPPKRIPDDAE